MENFRDVGKWILVIFVTGVIAGFGKLLASWIVKRSKRTPRPDKLPTPAPPSFPPLQEQSPPAQSPADERLRKKSAKQQTKIEKKLAKEEQKRRKRTRE